MRYRIHKLLRHWFLSKIAKAIYDLDPVPGWDFYHLREMSQIGNPTAERHYSNVYAAAEVALMVLAGVRHDQ